ncbi:Hypothetical predicted protein [Lecanosticta acicola]|uniref:Uncharacterized protein n=1 Tax=Lecanosticta acicola TaxID=111012 RepID=A0AAI8W109_9PEZI|nr:Hypothetical predicted protein [Lecanosticta acicola]
MGGMAASSDKKGKQSSRRDISTDCINNDNTTGTTSESDHVHKPRSSTSSGSISSSPTTAVLQARCSRNVNPAPLNQNVRYDAAGLPMRWDPYSSNSLADFRYVFHGIPVTASLPHFNLQGGGYAPSLRHEPPNASEQKSNDKAEAAKMWLRLNKEILVERMLCDNDDEEEGDTTLSAHNDSGGDTAPS